MLGYAAKAATNGRTTARDKSSLGKRSRGNNIAIMGEEEDYGDEGLEDDHENHEEGDPDGDQDAGSY